MPLAVHLIIILGMGMCTMTLFPITPYVTPKGTASTALRPELVRG